jgi:tetratricopeptide (TPR) repeat protein
MKLCLLALILMAGAIGADRPLSEIYREAREALAADDAARCAALLEPVIQDAQGDQAAPAQLALGIARLRIGKAEAAVAMLQKAAVAYADKPEAPNAFAPLGDALRAAGKGDEARLAYAGAANLPGDAPNIRYAKARLSELDGEAREATGEYAQAAELYLIAADQLLALGAVDPAYRSDARNLFTKVAKGTGKPGKDWRGEPTARAIYGLGEVERAAGQLPEAIAYYQRTFVSWVKYPQWAARAYLRAAECMDRLGKRDFAIRHLRELVRKVEKYGKLPEYQQAKQQLRAWGEDVR